MTNQEAESRTEPDPEYWRWTESRWTNPNLDWKSGEVISAGVDVGSVSSQAVIMVDDELYAYSNMRTGSNSPESSVNAMNRAMEDTGLALDDLHAVVGTGYGRVNVPFATRTLTEIACHARGANFMYGASVRTLLDMGGQDCKAIQVDEKGKVKAFLMNDKCAAGTGRGMEVFADLLGIHICDVGEVSLRVEADPPPLSSTCVVFSRSEAIRRLREGWPREKVLAAYCLAMSQRVVSLLERIGVEKDFAITGGISKNVGVVSRLAKELNVEPLTTDMDTQIAGALGAALSARTLYLRKLKKR